ncbi:MAG: DUF4386 domain-containing protein [Spirochaetales bacterium]|nr:DUF4386 domain-containing protein [Spirochaetales bacterium]
MSDPKEIRRTARIAGIFYLALGLTGMFSIMIVFQQLVIPGDMEATIANITTSGSLYRLGFAGNIASQIIFLVLAIMLYRLFVHVDKTQARLLVALVVASVPVTFIAMLAYLAPTIILNNPGYLAAFNHEQLKSLAMIFLDIHRMAFQMVEIFWGLWLLPLGILIIKSRFFPSVLGILEFAGCFGYVLAFLVKFLLPDGSPVLELIAKIAVFGEIPFMLWLIILGARFPESIGKDQETTGQATMAHSQAVESPGGLSQQPQ